MTRVTICLDAIDVLKLIIGQDVLVRNHDDVEVEILSGGTLWRMQQERQKRLVGKVHVAKTLPKRDYK